MPLRKDSHLDTVTIYVLSCKAYRMKNEEIHGIFQELPDEEKLIDGKVAQREDISTTLLVDMYFHVNQY